MRSKNIRLVSFQYERHSNNRKNGTNTHTIIALNGSALPSNVKWYMTPDASDENSETFINSKPSIRYGSSGNLENEFFCSMYLALLLNIQISNLFMSNRSFGCWIIIIITQWCYAWTSKRCLFGIECFEWKAPILYLYNNLQKRSRYAINYIISENKYLNFSMAFESYFRDRIHHCGRHIIKFNARNRNQ